MDFELLTIDDIFFFVGLGATILFCIKTFLFSSLDYEAEVFSDFTTLDDSDTAFGFLSISSVLAFFMGGGWFGWFLLKHTPLSLISIAVIAFIIGLAFMFGYAYLMFCIRKCEEIPDSSLKSAIGKIGRAYTSFNPKGAGQVEVEVNGRLTTVDAINATENEIAAFSQIKVLKEENNKLFIEPVM